MASHVVVVDSSFRRHTIKTTPNTYLTDVLSEACSKFGLSPDQYTLKHNGKPIDVSRTIRLSGLSGGAKLDLIQGSRSPAVVSVALQLPTTGEQAGSLARLTDKFPSNTTIWQILRRFESGVGSKPNQTIHYNFTQRATPQMTDNKEGPFAGSGRLVYEMPVITIMSRSLASFSDLQRTLGQLGFNSGSCLLRLSYSVTDQPLEAALASISQYFDEVDKAEPPSSSTSVPNNPSATDEKSQTQTDSIQPSLEGDNLSAANDTENPSTGSPRALLPSNAPRNAISDAVATPETQGSLGTESSGPSTENRFSSTSTNPNSSLNAGLSIFAPPSSSTPAAATSSHFNEADYTPTVEHAQTHQARLAQESRNRKLLSDDEISAQEAERDAALSTVVSVNVRIRFPDQSQAQKSFGQEATVKDLYQFCRELMHLPNKEEIELRSANAKGKMEQLSEDNRHLIKQLGWKGGVLVTVVWGPNVGIEARRRPSLKPEYRAQAQTMKVTPNPASADEGEDTSKSKILGMLSPKGKENGAGRSSGDKEAKLKKLLGFGKR